MTEKISDRGSRALTEPEILSAFEARMTKRKETEEAFLGFKGPRDPAPDPDSIAQQMNGQKTYLDRKEEQKNLPFNPLDVLKAIYGKMEKKGGVEFEQDGKNITMIHSIGNQTNNLENLIIDVSSKDDPKFKEKMDLFKKTVQILEDLFRAKNPKWQIKSEINTVNKNPEGQWSNFNVTVIFTIQGETVI